MAEHEEKTRFNVENEVMPTPVVLPRYRKLKRLSILVTSLVALIPLFIMTLLNYYQDQDAYHAETRYAISRLLSNTQKTLEYAKALGPFPAYSRTQLRRIEQPGRAQVGLEQSQ
jgi:hypothetical protein